MSSIRQRIQNLERTVGRTARSTNTRTIHAAMAKVLTDPQAHKVASSLGGRMMGMGSTADARAFKAMLAGDPEARNEAAYICNLLADVR